MQFQDSEGVPIKKNKPGIRLNTSNEDTGPKFLFALLKAETL